MTEEIKNQPTAGEQAVTVPSIPQGHTGSALRGAERNDRKPTDAWAALLELLGSKKIPPLDGVQMLALLHYLYQRSRPPASFPDCGGCLPL